MTADPRRRLDIEAAAAAELTRLLGEAIEDEELHAGMVEGSSNLFEAIDHAVAVADRAEADAEYLKRRIEQLQARRKRLEDVPRTIKRAIARALQTAGWDKPLRRPEYTVSRPGTGKARLVIFDPSRIPRDYWRQPDPPPPEPDKAAIRADLEIGQQVPGAELAPGDLSCSIRRT